MRETQLFVNVQFFSISSHEAVDFLRLVEVLDKEIFHIYFVWFISWGER